MAFAPAPFSAGRAQAREVILASAQSARARRRGRVPRAGPTHCDEAPRSSFFRRPSSPRAISRRPGCRWRTRAVRGTAVVAVPQGRMGEAHPIFDGLPAGGLMDYTFYREIIPDAAWVGQDVPAEVVAGATNTSQDYSAGLTVSVHSLGRGDSS